MRRAVRMFAAFVLASCVGIGIGPAVAFAEPGNGDASQVSVWYHTERAGELPAQAGAGSSWQSVEPSASDNKDEGIEVSHVVEDASWSANALTLDPLTGEPDTSALEAGKPAPLVSVSLRLASPDSGMSGGTSGKDNATSANGTSATEKSLSGIEYRVREVGGAWPEAWQADGSLAACLRGIDGVQVRLTGDAAASYDVWYRGRVSNGAWLDWVRGEGELLSANGDYLCAVQAMLVPKGSEGPRFSNVTPQDVTATSAANQALTAQTNVFDTTPAWKRLSGEDRYATMGAIVSEEFFQSDWAVIATGTNFPDALGASSLAGMLGCPVLITASGSLSAQAKSQLERLGVQNVYIVSGTSAVSDAVKAEIESMNIKAYRLAGTDRLETNIKTFREVRELGSTTRSVIVVSGYNFPDALSIGPWAYANGVPIVITRGNGTLTSEAVEAIQGDAYLNRVIVVGGENAVSSSIESQLGDGYEYVRLAGNDRYETSRDVVEWEIANGLTWSTPAIATGSTFPDALTGAALCGAKESVLLLGTKASEPTIKLLYENRDSIIRGYLLGGKASEPLDDPIAEYEQQDNPTNVLLHNVPWAGQPNSYYCGPTCGYMILSKLGATVSADGAPLSISNVADAMGTSLYGYTSFTDHMFENGMNSWLGENIYTTVPNPSYEEIRAAVLRSFETGYPMVVDEHEYYGGPHFNGHGEGTYSHILVIDGYNPSTDEVLFADSAAQVYWYGDTKFWYPSLKLFTETYLVPADWRDGIGMVCPR